MNSQLLLTRSRHALTATDVWRKNFAIVSSRALLLLIVAATSAVVFGGIAIIVALAQLPTGGTGWLGFATGILIGVSLAAAARWQMQRALQRIESANRLAFQQLKQSQETLQDVTLRMMTKLQQFEPRDPVGITEDEGGRSEDKWARRGVLFVPELRFAEAGLYNELHKAEPYSLRTRLYGRDAWGRISAASQSHGSTAFASLILGHIECPSATPTVAMLGDQLSVAAYMEFLHAFYHGGTQRTLLTEITRHRLKGVW